MKDCRVEEVTSSKMLQIKYSELERELRENIIREHNRPKGRSRLNPLFIYLSTIHFSKSSNLENLEHFIQIKL